jgi:hypothetical protein
MSKEEFSSLNVSDCPPEYVVQILADNLKMTAALKGQQISARFNSQVPICQATVDIFVGNFR